MDLSTDFLVNYLSSDWAIVAFFALLVAYRLASTKIRALPPVPVGLLLIYLVLRLVLNLLPATVSHDLVKWLTVASLVTLYCAIFRIAFAFSVEWFLSLRKHETLPKITRDFVLIAAYAVIIFIVLRTRGGVNLVGLITTSAVLTAVIGLAAQNTLGNLFAGISLQFEKPYGIGDWIQYGENTGQVVGIGWAATRLRTFEDEIVFVPNMDIAKSVLKNFSRPSRRHVMKIDIGLDYGAPPNAVRKVLLEALGDEPQVLNDPPPQIRVVDYADFAVKYQLRFVYDDFGTSPIVRSAVMNRLWYALRRNRISIPYPVRDVRLHHVERRVDLKRREEMRLAARASLDAVPILAPLSAAARDTIAKRMLVQDYGVGETVVGQGEAGDSMYILYRGSCEVLVKKGEAASIVVAALTAPAFFGEMSLLTGDPRTATVRTTEDSRLFAIDKGLFKEILSADPSISEQLARTLAQRQLSTATALDKQAADTVAQASNILARIKSFFSLS